MLRESVMAAEIQETLCFTIQAILMGIQQRFASFLFVVILPRRAREDSILYQITNTCKENIDQGNLKEKSSKARCVI